MLLNSLAHLVALSACSRYGLQPLDEIDLVDGDKVVTGKDAIIGRRYLEGGRRAGGGVVVVVLGLVQTPPSPGSSPTQPNLWSSPSRLNALAPSLPPQLPPYLGGDHYDLLVLFVHV